MQMTRTAASNGLSVLIRLGDELHHTMEIKSNCSVSVGNVQYSTDGPFPDTDYISLANTEVELVTLIPFETEHGAYKYP